MDYEELPVEFLIKVWWREMKWWQKVLFWFEYEFLDWLKGAWVWVLFVLVFGLSFGCLAGAVIGWM